MKNSQYFRRKGINFVGAIVLFISVFLMHDAFNTGKLYGIVDTKTVVWIFIYIMTGLALTDYKGITMLIERIWSLNCTEYDNLDSKLTLIKSYIELNVQQWDKYCRMYNAIVKEETKQWNTYQKVKLLILKIPKGELNLKQFIWILLYLTFNLVQGQGYIPPITQGYELLIDFGGLGFFMFTSGAVIGLGTFMGDIFKSIAPHSTRKTIESLTLLETHIIYGARWYGFLRNMTEIKCDEHKEQTPDCIVKG